PPPISGGGLGEFPGGVLLSHRVSPAVPSALEGLTSVFEMGTGVAPPAKPPETLKARNRECEIHRFKSFSKCQPWPRPRRARLVRNRAQRLFSLLRREN